MSWGVACEFNFVLDEEDGTGVVVGSAAFDFLFEAEDVGGGMGSKFGEKLLVDGGLFFESFRVDLGDSVVAAEAVGERGGKVVFGGFPNLELIGESFLGVLLVVAKFFDGFGEGFFQAGDVGLQVKLIGSEQGFAALLHDFTSFGVKSCDIEFWCRWWWSSWFDLGESG